MYKNNNLEYLVGSSNSYKGCNPSPIYMARQSFAYSPEHTNLGSPIAEQLYQKVRDSTVPYSKMPEYERLYAISHHFKPTSFLNKNRPISNFVVDKDEIMGFVKDTFWHMMGKMLPEDLYISILSHFDFKIAHSMFGRWQEGIVGFSINGKEKKIFIRQNDLDQILLVIGHEIGHIVSDTLSNPHDEEAKAFSFSIEWARTIKKHNIANLAGSIKDDIEFSPARNGLHDVALEFVNLMTKKGRSAMDLHKDLARRYLSIFGTYF